MCCQGMWEEPREITRMVTCNLEEMTLTDINDLENRILRSSSNRLTLAMSGLLTGRSKASNPETIRY